MNEHDALRRKLEGAMAHIDREKLKIALDELEELSKETGYGIHFIQSVINSLALEEIRELLIELMDTEKQNAEQRAGLLRKYLTKK